MQFDFSWLLVGKDMLKFGMNTGHLDVYILKTPGNSRADVLIQKLSTDYRVSLRIIDSVMIGNDTDIQVNRIDLESVPFKVLEGRNLSFGEIGCAHTHNLARRKISESNFGGVVLEDDARIEDVDKFIEIAIKFLAEYKSTTSILTLTSFWGEKESRQFAQSKISVPWIKLIGHAPLAVAYVATPMAAAEVLAKNNPIKFVADWPLNSSVFYTLKRPTVRHGDESTTSLIDKTNTKFRRSAPLSKKISLFSFHLYLTTGRKNVKFREYLAWVYFRRIKWVFDKIRARIMAVQ